MNLTETQKRVLRWLVEEERAGNLDKEGIWFAPIFPNSMSLSTTYRGNLSNIPQIERTTFDALRSNGYLKCDWMGKCALTDESYEVVDSKITRNIGNNPNKLSEKIVIVSEKIVIAVHAEGVVNQVNADQSGTNNTQNNTFNF
jgi:hypothetical protein